MIRSKIGLYAGGVAGMIPFVDLLSIHQDPTIIFTEYAAVVAQDLDGRNIEAGFAHATLTWRIMPQSDFDTLLGFANTQVISRLRNNSGASGYDFANYSGYTNRPTADVDETRPLLRLNVSMSITTLVPI